MPVGTIEHEIHDAYVRLAESAATARRCYEHYLDDPGGPLGRAGRDLASTVTALTAAHPYLPVVLGLRHGQRLLPLRLVLLMLLLCRLETGLGLGRLPLVAGGSAQ